MKAPHQNVDGKLKIETNQLPNSYLRIQMLPWHPSSLLLASLVAFLLQDISEVELSSLGYQFCACLHLFLHQAGVEMKHERQGTRYLQYNVTQKIFFAQICRTQEVYFSPVEFYHTGLSIGEHRCRRENSECAQACSSPGHPVRSFPGHTGSSKFTFNTSEHLSSIFLIILLVLSIPYI